MTEIDWLASQFEESRTHLRKVAYRMLGSMSDADDAVQEAWLRLSRSDTGQVENLRAWLTTVVARVSLDMLRSKRRRGEDTDAESAVEPAAEADAEHDLLMAESVGLALQVILDTLEPAERVAFVLHDMFDLPYDEIAPIVGRSSEAARQLASRARRRVQRNAEVPEADFRRHQEVVDAFLAAARTGDFAALLDVLDPDVVVRADAAAVKLGARTDLRGATTLVETFARRARALRPALIDGVVGMVSAPGGTIRLAFSFTLERGRVKVIDIIADRARLEELDVAILD